MYILLFIHLFLNQRNFECRLCTILLAHQLPGDLEFRSTIYCTYHLGMVTKTYLRSEIHTNFTARWSLQLKNNRDFQREP